MKSKFKVGDRVICINAVDGNKKIVGQKGTIREITGGRRGLGIEFDKQVHCFNECNTTLKLYHGWYVSDSDIELIENEKIVIYRKNNEVIAKNVTTGKIGVAKCDPRDEFKFEIGAKLALERLTNNVTFKILCIRTGFDLTKGKVYEAIDGEITYDNGQKGWGYVDFNEYMSRNRYLRDTVVELKDGDDINEILKRYDTSIKKGDRVKIGNSGGTYTTYVAWSGLQGYEGNFVSGILPNTDKTYRVRAIKKHDSRNKTLALIQDEFTTQVFIIDIHYLKKESE